MWKGHGSNLWPRWIGSYHLGTSFHSWALREQGTKLLQWHWEQTNNDQWRWDKNRGVMPTPPLLSHSGLSARLKIRTLQSSEPTSTHQVVMSARGDDRYPVPRGVDAGAFGREVISRHWPENISGFKLSISLARTGLTGTTRSRVARITAGSNHQIYYKISQICWLLKIGKRKKKLDRGSTNSLL